MAAFRTPTPDLPRGRPGGCFPTPRQAQLLRAALLEGDEARVAFAHWRRDLDLATLDTGSVRLLPLLYRKLVTLGVDDAILPILRGIHRKTWVDNQLLHERAARILTVFRDAGIPTLLLKGAALVAGYYRDLSVRPMMDLDVLVPTGRADLAVDVLTAAGFAPEGERTPAMVKQLAVPTTHAWSFRDAAGRDLDLHWHALHLSRQANADDPFWERAVPMRVREIATLRLDPADQLLHVVVHGMWWVSVPSLRWVADSAVLLRREAVSLDWDRLLAQARSRSFTLALRETLRYLTDLLGVPVPREVLGRLRRPIFSPLQHLELRATTRPPENRSPAQRFALGFRRTERQSIPLGRRANPLVYAEILRELWRLDSTRLLPLFPLVSRMRRDWRLRARLRTIAPALAGHTGLPTAALPSVLNRAIDFSLSGDSRAILRSGWSCPEPPDGTWTDGREAWLSLPIGRRESIGSAHSIESARATPLFLTVALQAFLSERHPWVRVEVVVNDQPLDQWTFRYGRDGAETKTVEIPATIAARLDPLDVVFVVHAPASPLALGLGRDDRQLGVYVRRLTLRAPEESPSARLKPETTLSSVPIAV